MAKALREIKQRLPMVDIIFEIRDARAPLVSGNPSLGEVLGQKPRLILLNKANLASDEVTSLWCKWFEEKKLDYQFLNCFDKNALKKVMSQARKIVDDNNFQSNPETAKTKNKLRVMMIGLPNTGKSTIINLLAGKQAVKVANKPGLTQIQQWIKVNDEVELLDTPGVMPPEVSGEQHALWLSAIHALPDHIAGEDTTAAFVIKHLLNENSKVFMGKYKLESSKISLEEAFVKIATVRGCLKQKGLPDIDRVCKLVLADFREGELGKTSFELPG